MLEKEAIEIFQRLNLKNSKESISQVTRYTLKRLEKEEKVVKLPLKGYYAKKSNAKSQIEDIAQFLRWGKNPEDVGEIKIIDAGLVMSALRSGKEPMANSEQNFAEYYIRKFHSNKSKD